jgi:hypothetical protein
VECAQQVLINWVQAAQPSKRTVRHILLGWQREHSRTSTQGAPRRIMNCAAANTWLTVGQTLVCDDKKKHATHTTEQTMMNWRIRRSATTPKDAFCNTGAGQGFYCALFSMRCFFLCFIFSVLYFVCLGCPNNTTIKGGLITQSKGREPRTSFSAL